MKRKIVLSLIGILGVFIEVSAQKLPLFDNMELLEMVDRGGDHIYNENFDLGFQVIDSIDAILPGHPIVGMMRAMNYAWQDQPITTSSPIFGKHMAELDKTLAATGKIREDDEQNLEAIFFEMSVHGLKAEYYAQEGSYLKAMSQAQRTYSLLRLTMEQTDKSSEFYFLAGLYNYFREKYPERHPVYNSFLWFFKTGDVERGLIQLDSAVNHSKIIKIEASLYLSYIYLRYENRPEKSIKYLKDLNDMYPENSYFKTKLVEALVFVKEYEQAQPLIQDLINHGKPYYQLCGFTYQAVYFEEKLKSASQAERYYKRAIQKGKECPDKGEFYRSLAYLGMGRIMEARKEYEKAATFYELAIEEDESPEVTQEAEKRLNGMN